MDLKNRIDIIDNNDGKKAKIADFGEKIGGARKDVYMARGGLDLVDLDGMNEREYKDHIKKDNVWPKPKDEDFKGMVARGIHPAVVYYIKKLRDALPSKPVNDTYAHAKIYIELVKIYKDVASELRSTLDLHNIWRRVQEEAIIRDFKYIKSRTYKKVIEVAMLRGISVRELEIETEIQDFPNHFKGALKGLTIREYNGSTSLRKVFLIIKGDKMVSGYRDTYTTEEEALRVVKEEVVPKLIGASVNKKKDSVNKFVRPQLKDIVRTGEDFRVGKDVSGEDMLKAFGFRGGEFGNWNTQADRKACLNYSYDALCDLASVLRVPFDFISLGGYKDKKLAIAYGARGKGSALAHYEPSNVVINLTKLKGAGALAHEWGHALDDYIGIKCGYNGLFTKMGTGFRSKTTEYVDVQEAFRSLMDTLKYRDSTDEEMVLSKRKNLNMYLSNVNTHLIGFENKSIRTKEGYKPIDDEAKAKLIVVKEKLISKMTIEALDELCKVHKEVTKVLPSKDLRDSLGNNIRQYEYTKDSISKIESGEVEYRGKKDTIFYKGAKELDKYRTDGYYQSNVELFARAFEAYIEDSIKDRGHKSDYLVHSTQCSYYPGMQPYPVGDERKLFNAKFKEFLELVATTFSTLEDEEVFISNSSVVSDVKDVTDVTSDTIEKVIEDKDKKEDIMPTTIVKPTDTKEDDAILERVFGSAFEPFEEVSNEVAITKDVALTELVDNNIGHFTPTDLSNSCKELGFNVNIKMSPKQEGVYKLIFKNNEIVDYVLVGVSNSNTPYNYLVKVVYTNGMFTYEWGNKLGCNGIANFINSKTNKRLK